MRSARGSRGRWTGWPKPGARSPASWIAVAARSAAAVGVVARLHARLRLDQELRAQLGGAEDDRPAAEDPGGDRALERSGIGREGHPGRDVRGHHPVLGDGDQEQVEEVALLVGRLLAREQEVEVLGEA